MLSSFGNLVMVHSCVEQEGDMHLLQRFLQDESGATAIEYGLGLYRADHRLGEGC